IIAPTFHNVPFREIAGRSQADGYSGQCRLLALTGGSAMAAPTSAREGPIADKRQVEIPQCSSLLAHLVLSFGQASSASSRFRMIQVWPKDVSASARQVERAVDRAAPRREKAGCPA